MVTNIVVGTLVLAAIYGLVGAGFVLLFRATGVLNFAQGAFMVVGALIFWTLTQALSLGLVAGFVISMVVVAVCAMLAYRVLLARLQGVSGLVLTIASVGLGTALLAVANLIWGPDEKTISGMLGNHRIVIAGSLGVTPIDIAALVVGVVGLAGLTAFIRFTRAGLRMRATADSTILAAYSGARPRRMSALAWALAGATAAAAGICYALRGPLDPPAIFGLGLAVFPAIILGGIDSLGGVVLGAFLIGLVQSTVNVVIGAAWGAPVSYLVLVVVIMVRPRGLFGSVHAARV